MKKLTGIVLLLIAGFMPLCAADGETEYSEFVKGLLNNKFLLENKRLIGLAEGSYEAGKYEEAVKYAQDALLNAQKSDQLIAAQAAVDTAQKRFAWATANGGPTRYANEYGEAKTALAAAQDALEREDWEAALAAAKKVMDLLSIMPDTPTLAAKYKVKNWKPNKDCLWNIAALPQIYGDPFKWKVLYDANKSKFPKPDNPNIIEPGTILDIPSIKGEVRAGTLE
jgi:nucleoid-associated protein YgaU